MNTRRRLLRVAFHITGGQMSDYGTGAPPGAASMLDDGTINGKIAKAAFDEVMACGKPPRAIVAERALVQVTDADVIGAAIDRVLGAHSDEVAKYRGGKDELFDCFVGR